MTSTRRRKVDETKCALAGWRLCLCPVKPTTRTRVGPSPQAPGLRERNDRVRVREDGGPRSERMLRLIAAHRRSGCLLGRAQRGSLMQAPGAWARQEIHFTARRTLQRCPAADPPQAGGRHARLPRRVVSPAHQARGPSDVRCGRLA
eukprot:7390682-Prymnesium_polylepis.2